MSKLDLAKEQIAYLKFWLGVMIVTDMSLVGWLVSSAEAAPAYKVWSAIVAIIVITLMGLRMHRQIERRIDTLEDL
jgi:hypothetical protein